MTAGLETHLAALLAWTRAHPAYSYAVDATEYAGRGVQTSSFQIVYDARGPYESVRVVRGKGAGSVVVWRGGDRVSVRTAGVLHVLPITLGIRDARVLSIRGNDVRAGIFARVAHCLAAHAANIATERASESLVVLSIHDAAGIHCGEEDGDSAVTVDRVTISSRDAQPVMRERYVGETLVERWIIRDLRVSR